MGYDSSIELFKNAAAKHEHHHRGDMMYKNTVEFAENYLI